MTKTIKITTFTDEIFAFLGETFENVQGIYLDKGTSLFETLKSISAAEASVPVGGRCATLAAQVDHTRYYLDILEVYMRGEKPQNVDWRWIWENVGPVTEEEWHTIQERLHASYTRIKEAVAAMEDWDNGDAVGASIAFVAHTAYHLGEIRQALCILKG